jgi:hypothetical protein
VIFDPLDAHRLERAVADVERNLRDDDTGAAQGVEQRPGEVKAGGRRGHRPARASEDGLIALAVDRRIGTVNVRRKRDVADRFDDGIDVLAGLRLEADGAPPEGMLRQDLPEEPALGPFADEAAPRLQLLTRVDQRVPAICIEPRQQQALDGAARRVAATDQARREHPRVVQDEHVTRPQKTRQVADERAFRAARHAIEDEEPGGPAGLGRRLRDELRRQLEVEVGDEHRERSAGRPVPVDRRTGPGARRRPRPPPRVTSA